MQKTNNCSSIPAKSAQLFTSKVARNSTAQEPQISVQVIQLPSNFERSTIIQNSTTTVEEITTNACEEKF